MADDDLKDFQRALVVVAHPDDAEFGCAGTVALWTRAGVEVGYVICTDGSAGAADQEVDISLMAEIRQREQRAACRVLGVSSVEFLGHPDGQLVADLALRKELTRMIRRYRPDRVICQNAVRTYTNIYGNHPDHLAAGQSTLEAIYPFARNPYAYPDLREEGLEPHRVREVWITGTDSPNQFVDVESTLERKLEALAQHASQRRPGDDPSDRVKQRLRDQGRARGIAYAESFRLLNSE